MPYFAFWSQPSGDSHPERGRCSSETWRPDTWFFLQAKKSEVGSRAVRHCLACLRVEGNQSAKEAKAVQLAGWLASP